MIYGVDVENVTISGPGLIDGSDVNDRGETINVLSGGDPREVTTRTDAGVPGGGNKAIALKNARNIVFRFLFLRREGRAVTQYAAAHKGRGEQPADKPRADRIPHFLRPPRMTGSVEWGPQF